MARRRGRGKTGIFDVPKYTPELEEAVSVASQFFMDLRGVGHFLAPEDSRLLQGWLGDDVPVDIVLTGMINGCKRLDADGRPVRNMRNLRRDIQKEVTAFKRLRVSNRSSRQTRGVQPTAKPTTAKPATASKAYQVALEEFIGSHLTFLDVMIDQSKSDGLHGWVLASESAMEALVSLREAGCLPAGSAVPKLVSIGRRFYDEILASLSPEQKSALRQDAEAALQGWVSPMSAKAREETIQQMTLQSLRRMVTLFDVQAIYSLWEM